jgi:hypothetical protein
VVTAPAAAGKFANYFSLNPCKILPSSDIAAIIRVKSTHQTILDWNTYACGWSTGHLTADIIAPLSVSIVEEVTENNYVEAGVTVSLVAGVPVNLVVFSATALQPNLVARAHVQFSVPIKGRYWEVQAESGSNAQLERLARELHAALGGYGQTLTTIQSAGQKEASDMKPIVADVRTSNKAAEKVLCEAIAGSAAGTCSGTVAPEAVEAYVQELQGDQAKLGAALTIVDQAGQIAESVGAAVQAPQHSISGLNSMLSEAEASVGTSSIKGDSGAPLKLVQDALTALGDLSSLLIAK